MPDYTGGYTAAVQGLDQMQAQAIVNQMRQQTIMQQAMQMAAQQRATQARGPAFDVLARSMGGGAGLPPPPPGTTQGGPQPPGPGVSSQPMAPPQPQQAAPVAAPPQIPPFKPLPAQGGMSQDSPANMPRVPQPNAAPAGGAIPPPPPAAAPQPASDAQDTTPRWQGNIAQVIKQLDAMGVPSSVKMDMLDEMMPVLDKQQRQELDFYKAHNAALSQANNLYVKLLTAGVQQKRADTQERDVDSKIERRATGADQGQQRIDLAKKALDAKLRAKVGGGGSGALKSVEYVYPKGEDGRPDESKPPIGTRGVTKTGKIVYVAADGAADSASQVAAGGTAKEAKDTKGSAAQNVRTSLVTGSAANALRLLDEAEKLDANTSAFFGSHAENPATKAMYGVGKNLTMTQKDRQVDAKWAGIIEEVGPVLSGGLRNSDAFRRFLIEQAPTLGDDKETRKQKMKILRDNVDGTSKAFFNKFAADPNMWGEGITKQEVDAAKAHAAAPAGAGPAVGEKRTINGVPAHWDGTGWLPDG